MSLGVIAVKEPFKRDFKSVPLLRRPFADHSRLKHGAYSIIGSRRGACS